MIWWLPAALAAFLLLMFLWCAGSYFYLRFRYRRLSHSERLRFFDLQKEEKTRQ